MQSSLAWLSLFFGVTIGIALLWGAILAKVRPVFRQKAGGQIGATLLGLVICGLIGFLLTTPVGVSKLSLKIYAKDVWSPDIFQAIWSETSQGSTPFTIPSDNPPISGSLEIVPAQLVDTSTSSGEVWLVGATWADGSPLPLDVFEAEPGWSLVEFD
ncbi:MAG: hypothetical protein AAF485_17225, partial [Chloroflexota bacterium]